MTVNTGDDANSLLLYTLPPSGEIPLSSDDSSEKAYTLTGIPLGTVHVSHEQRKAYSLTPDQPYTPTLAATFLVKENRPASFTPEAVTSEAVSSSIGRLSESIPLAVRVEKTMRKRKGMR